MIETEGIKAMVGVMLVGSALILGLGGFGSWVVAVMFIMPARSCMVAGRCEPTTHLTLPHPCRENVREPLGRRAPMNKSSRVEREYRRTRAAAREECAE